MKKVLIILVGNIGTGKPSFCEKLKKPDRFVVSPDNYSGTPLEKRQRMIKEIENGLDNYKYVIVDGPSLRIKDRDKLLYFAVKIHCKVIVFDFGPGNEISLERRIRNNPELLAEEWRKIHLENQANYERPEMIKGYSRVVRINCSQNAEINADI